MSEVKAPEVTVNENTASVAEPIVAHGGDSAVSFDDLERVMESPMKGEDKVAAKETKDKQVDTKTSKINDKLTKEKDEKEDGKETKETSTKESKDNKETKTKSYKVKNGEVELDLTSDSLIDVVVNGKKEQTTIQDLLNNYSGKTSWDRKFTELDQQRKSFEASKNTMQKTLDTFYNLAVKENNPYEAINYLGDLLGTDMGKFWDDFSTQMLPKLDEMHKMTPEQRKLQEYEMQLERYRKKESEARSKMEEQKLYSQVESTVKSLQEKHGISDAEFFRAYSDLKDSGAVKEDDITPELVAEYYSELNTRGKIAEFFDGVETNMTPEQKLDAVEQLRKISINDPSLSMDDLRDIAVEVWGDKKARTLNNKLKKSKPTNTSMPTKRQQSDPWSFDHLEA